MEPAPIWTDLKSFPWAEFRDRVDILTGGYPCQPFSAAGKRLGTEDPRHLWPFIADGIRILRPKLCFFENVEGHISLGLREVIGDLEQIGYTTAWGIFSASEVGAPHQRKRVFILAHCKSDNEWWKFKCRSSEWDIEERLEKRLQARGLCSYAWPSRPGEPQYGWEPPRVVAECKTIGQRNAQRNEHEECMVAHSEDRVSVEFGGSPSASAWPVASQTQPALGGSLDGTSGGLGYAELCVACDNRTDELRLLGNGVVPATAERAFRVLIEELI